MDTADNGKTLTENKEPRTHFNSVTRAEPIDDGATHMTPRDIEPPQSPSDVDRLSVIWRAKYLIIAVTIVVAGGVYAISSKVTPTYSSSATIAITAASTPGGSAQDVALASNDLAAQDAQLVEANDVLSQASKTLGVSASTLSSHLSSGTVAAQNLVQITVQSSNPTTAQTWANVVSRAFQAFMVHKGVTSASALQSSLNAQVAPLNHQITVLQLQIAATQPAAPPGSAALIELQGEENQLSGLLASRATLMDNTALAIVSQQPNVAILQSASAPSKISPRPLLYGVIAALAALLVTAQLVIVAKRRRASIAAR
jgi:capsular polysaccharide biosynthesis protein